MTGLPIVDDSLLVRTTFSDDAAWAALVAAVARETAEGFRAYVNVVDDRDFDATEWKVLRTQVLANRPHALVLFVADAVAMSTLDFPILVVDVAEDYEPFRCTARELWSVDNNLNIGNMDWADFSRSVELDGVFRGFGSA
ncbi:MAG: hypothetical protein JWN80_1539 [Microbacteriaceae bacterium]|nr:hypothetical protein [Microbacteriaceae bacterium]